MTEKRREYLKQWRLRNRKRQTVLQRVWRKDNPDKYKGYSKKDDLSSPWRITWRSIQLRVKDINNPYYGEIGIKNLLKMKDLEFLWNRDNAWNMNEPRIHRKDSKKDYTVSNCKYIEEKEHASFHRKLTLGMQK